MTWTRNYQYDTVTKPPETGTSAPGGRRRHLQRYVSYRGNGAMNHMTSLPVIEWDYADRMRHANRGSGGGDVFFTYDGAGQRVRKVQAVGRHAR